MRPLIVESPRQRACGVGRAAPIRRVERAEETDTTNARRDVNSSY
jgi:hypothetical protein